ncbi:MAG: hypothetical protein BGO77_07290 [Caedibacter sp. 37-49]|nr:MAG: hypothetical protein BGO77_07290 [Caedibacter sp. 37-49]
MHKNIFLAVLFENKLKEKLAHNLRLSAPIEEIIYTPKQNIHLTLGFIRNVDFHDRSLLKKAFNNIKTEFPFEGFLQRSIILGNGNSLCIRAEPFEKLAEIHLASRKLLRLNTENKYDFDNTFDYLPHIKIQSLRPYLTIERKTMLLEEFSRKCDRRIEFYVSTLALMERQGDFYHIIKKYLLDSSSTN